MIEYETFMEDTPFKTREAAENYINTWKLNIVSITESRDGDITTVTVWYRT